MNHMPSFPHLRNNRSINIAKLLIIEAGSFAPQFHRPYQSVVNPDVVRRVKNHVDANNSVEPGVLANVISDILYPSVAPEVDATGAPKVVNIVNQWETPRYRFIMEVVSDDGIVAKTELVQGYSSYVDHTLQGNINPNLEFTINSVAVLKKVVYPTPTGNQTGISVVNSSHLLANTYYDGIDRNGFRGENLFHMRPTDMYSFMATSHVSDEIEVNTTGMQTDVAELSDRKNNVPTSYAARVFDGMRKATLSESLSIDTGAGVGSSAELMLSRAKQYVQEPVAVDINFLSALSQIHGMASTNKFTLSDLSQLDPNVGRVTTHAMLAPTERMSLPHAGDSEYWHGQDPTTHVAAILGAVIPSIMVECGITSIAFMVTNRTMDNSIHFTPARAPTGFVNGVDISRPMEVFKLHLINRCLNSISMNGMRDFMINVNANLTSASRFEIALDGNQNLTPYNQPSFCDALLTPTVTQYSKTGVNLANDLYHLANAAVLPQDTGGFASTEFGF